MSLISVNDMQNYRIIPKHPKLFERSFRTEPLFLVDSVGLDAKLFAVDNDNTGV